jgi:hypothetical protein
LCAYSLNKPEYCYSKGYSERTADGNILLYISIAFTISVFILIGSYILLNQKSQSPASQSNPVKSKVKNFVSKYLQLSENKNQPEIL